jgi:hypothetical protein
MLHTSSSPTGSSSRFWNLQLLLFHEEKHHLFFRVAAYVYVFWWGHFFARNCSWNPFRFWWELAHQILKYVITDAFALKQIIIASSNKNMRLTPVSEALCQPIEIPSICSKPRSMIVHNISSFHLLRSEHRSFIYKLVVKWYISTHHHLHCTTHTCHYNLQPPGLHLLPSLWWAEHNNLTESSLLLSLRISPLNPMNNNRYTWKNKASKAYQGKRMCPTYTLNLELATPLAAILSTRRRPKGNPKNDRTTPPISVLQSGHTAFILSHLSTHCTWNKWLQGSSRSSSSSPYLVRQMQHTCANISTVW